MRTLLIALLALPLMAQRTITLEPIKLAPVIRPNPEDALSKADRLDPAKVRAAWVATIKRPRLKAARDSRRRLRMRHCRARGGGLIIGQRAQYADPQGVTWYVSAAPSFGVVAVRSDRLLTELGCSPRYRDGRHDRRELRGYFASEIKAGSVANYLEIPEGWKAVAKP